MKLKNSAPWFLHTKQIKFWIFLSLRDLRVFATAKNLAYTFTFIIPCSILKMTEEENNE